MPPAFQVRPIEAAEARPLRHRVLRPNQPFEATIYPLDGQPESGHFGAFIGDRLIGVASIYHEPQPDETDAGAWRLRGMATVPEERDQGIGSALMHACFEHIRTEGGTTLWFNARTTAAGFYSRFGFAVKGGVFDLPGIGPHVIMERSV